MTEATVAVRETSSGVPPVGPGNPEGEVGAVLRLAQSLADRLLDLRGAPVHSIRLARAMALNVVDVLEGLQAGRADRQP